MSKYIGTDIGTSGCKSVIFDEDVRQVPIAYWEYDIISENTGWAGLDTDEVIGNCFEVIKESASRLEEGSVVNFGNLEPGRSFYTD